MSFHWPHFFWLLLLPLAMAAVELRRRHEQRNHTHPKILRAEASSRQLTLTPEGGPVHPSARLRWRLWLGLVFVSVALARPQWGKLDEPVLDQSREIVIALDLSRSMLSDDVKPSRLERSKLLISSLLEQLHGERIGLVVFSGTAFLQSPLSADYEILRDFMPSLTPSYMPEGGTNYNALLDTALNAFGSSGSADRFLIILSDGEATDDDWKPRVAALKEKGIRVLGLGVGTAAGSMIPDGSGAFVKDERGAVVLSKLESSTLQQLSAETNGLYADASTWVDLAQLIDHTVSSGKKGTFLERSRVRLAERFQWALAPALFFFFWSYFRDFPVRPRLRHLKWNPTPAAVKSAASSPAPGARALLLLPFLAYSLFTYPGHARAAEDRPPSGEAVAKLVASLSQHPALSAHDCADFVHATISYGKDLQAAQQHVPAGPVNDGLAAVDEGERLDPKAADWPALRRELEALLKKKDPPPQPQQSPQQKKEDQKKQEQPQQKQQQNSQSQPQNQSQDSKQQQAQNQNAPKPPPQKQPGTDQKDRSAEKAEQPPQPTDPADQQKVGGGQEKKEAPATKDPALALPLQKLEQIKDQDSPAKLYQLMQGQTSAPAKPGKDW